jgi:ATP-binding cassette subfamily B protein
VDGIETIRGLCASHSNYLRAESIVASILRPVFRGNLYQMAIATCGEVSSSPGLVVLFWFGGSLVLTRGLSVGELLSFYTLLGYLMAPIGRLSVVQQAVQEAAIAAERLFEVLTLETEDKLHHGNLALSGDVIRGEITFHNCSFRYGSRKRVLVNLNAHIPAGSITALVGECGSGKTTVLRLLQKYYDLSEGRILLDGIDLTTIATSSLRSVIGVVPQQIDIFHGTVTENIALGDIAPDVGRVLDVARQVGADKFIEELPAGYDTLLGEHGVILSGGQSQLLAVARSLYRQPRILLLDEPTSAVDSEAESLLQGLVCTLRRQGRTIIIAAHRLSTIQHADKIIVLEKGCAIEEGGHHDLLLRRGKYFTLWTNQIMPRSLQTDLMNSPGLS